MKVTSWNVECKLSETSRTKRGHPDQIMAMIRKINADVLMLVEAHVEDSLENLKHHKELLNMGYRIYNVPYQNDTLAKSSFEDAPLSLMLLSKLPMNNCRTIRLGDKRNALTAVITDPKSKQQFRMIGIHMDDRSEETRLKQAKELSVIINESDLPTVMAGDYNAMHGEDIWPAKLLRSRPIKRMSNYVLPAISIRAVEMARGEALQILESTGLHDADPTHRPTTTPKMRGFEWLPSIRLIQIDHIFISDSIKVNSFHVAADGGADHRAITAELNIQ